MLPLVIQPLMKSGKQTGLISKKNCLLLLFVCFKLITVRIFSLSFSLLLHRMIEFYVEDNQGGSSLRSSTIQLSIIPINDAPILFFIPDATLRDSPQIFSTGNRSLTFQYTEDDTPLYFGRYIYLRDVDSNIISATLQLTSKGMIDNFSMMQKTNYRAYNNIQYWYMSDLSGQKSGQNAH